MGLDHPQRSGPEFSIPRSPKGCGERRNLHATSNRNGNGRQSIRTRPWPTGQNVEVGSSHVGRGRGRPDLSRTVGGVQEGPRPDTGEASARPHRTDRALFGARQETCRSLLSRRGEGERGLVAAEAKLLSEEDAIRQAEDRLRVLRQEEASKRPNQPRFQPISHRSWRSCGISCRSCRGRGTSCAWSSGPCRARERERSLHHDGNVDRLSGECSEVRFIGDAHEPLVSEQDARFGHRASRIGEASHPGPPMQVAHGDIVDCLEFDLTRCDSADGLPPIPRQEGRRVVRRAEHSAISPIRFQPPITIGSRCWTHPCWQMFPLLLTRSLRWRLTTFQWCTVDRGCV